MSEALDRLQQRVRERAERRARQEAEQRADQEAWLKRLEDEQRDAGERFSLEQDADRAFRESEWAAEIEKRRPQRSGPGCPSCGVLVDINGGCRCS